MDCSTPGLPVHHQPLEFTQTHVHWVGDAIQPPHPLLSPSPPTFNLSQHQGLFKWVSSLHQVAKVLEFQLQHQYICKEAPYVKKLFSWQGMVFQFYKLTLMSNHCAPQHMPCMWGKSSFLDPWHHSSTIYHLLGPGYWSGSQGTLRIEGRVTHLIFTRGFEVEILSKLCYM